MALLKETSSSRCFSGKQIVFSHESSSLNCTTKFSVFVPVQADSGPVPVIYYLSGLTCTELNFMQKSNVQRIASELGVLIVAPDTSPRGCNIDGEDESWDFGTGASFYVDATEEKWQHHYRMYSYITKELQQIVKSKYNILPGKQSIMGHSMGGHGALICALKNPGQYCSVSAFAPICNPITVPWGQKAFTGYLGTDKETWKEYDACELIKKYNGPPIGILIDQGDADEFLKDQLCPETLVRACTESKLPVQYRLHEGYDHSYYFITSFIDEHIRYHVKCMNL